MEWAGHRCQPKPKPNPHPNPTLTVTVTLTLTPSPSLTRSSPEAWLLPQWFPLHPARLWCHCRMVYLTLTLTLTLTPTLTPTLT